MLIGPVAGATGLSGFGLNSALIFPPAAATGRGVGAFGVMRVLLKTIEFALALDQTEVENGIDYRSLSMFRARPFPGLYT